MKKRLAEILIQDRRTLDPQSEEAHKRPYLGLDQVESQSGRILSNVTLAQSEGESTTFAFDKRHILYGKLRPYLNKVALPAFTGRCTTELIPFLPGEEVDRDFAAWLLRSPVVLARACSQNNGARMPRVDMDHFLKFEVDVPDLPTQRRIAAQLKEQMAGVEAARKAVEAQQEAVDPLFEKLLAEAFHGITPLSLGIAADAAPAGWTWRRLLDVARLESGHTPSRKHPEYWENGDIPWLALPDIRALDCRVACDTSGKNQRARHRQLLRPIAPREHGGAFAHGIGRICDDLRSPDRDESGFRQLDLHGRTASKISHVAPASGAQLHPRCLDRRDPQDRLHGRRGAFPRLSSRTVSSKNNRRPARRGLRADRSAADQSSRTKGRSLRPSRRLPARGVCRAGLTSDTLNDTLSP